MTPEKVLAACDAYKGTPKRFADVLRMTLELDGVTIHDVADDFEVAVHTFYRWSAGTAHPRPRVRAFVLAGIRRRMQSGPGPWGDYGFGSAALKMREAFDWEEPV